VSRGASIIRRAAALGGLWLAATVGATAIGIAAVDKVGVEVGREVAAPSVAEAGPTPTGTTPTDRAAPPDEGVLPLPWRSPAPSPSPWAAEPAPPQTGSPSPPSNPAPTAAPTATRRSTPATGDPASTRTVELRGGIVALRCAGSRVVLVYARPDNGFQAQTAPARSEGLAVEFSPGGGHFTALCSGGRVITDTEEHDD
jgi:hypothetical protein